MFNTNSSTSPGAEGGTNPARVVIPQPGQVRLPAVAGLFYPGDAVALSDSVLRLLADAPVGLLAEVRALISPHAGYTFSGPIAAHAYKQLLGHAFETVIVLGPSHFAEFKGVSVPMATSYRTPLGDAPISDKAARLIGRGPFVAEPRGNVQRPGWWRRAAWIAPSDDEDTPETWEHSVEVQVPFLQTALRQFRLLPLLFGDVDPAEAALGLAEILDDQTLIVVSTDLSHFHSYEEASRRDRECVGAICDLDITRMKTQEACGKTPMLTLLHLARQRGWQPRLLDYRNSGDTAGEKSSVVGYTAIAFDASTGAFPILGLSEADKTFLLGLARRTLARAAGSPSGSGLPEIPPDTVPERLRNKRACFVTLRKAGELRGCIGSITPQDPLYLALMQNTFSAARRDSRFTPVAPDELEAIKIEVSVLADTRPLRFSSPENLLQQLRPHRDGVVLKIGFHTATFLPQVWEQFADKEQFMNRLSQKAGYLPSAWRGADVTVSTYQVEAFREG